MLFTAQFRVIQAKQSEENSTSSVSLYLPSVACYATGVTLTCKMIGERLFDARDRAGLTLRALGEKAGVSWSTISAVEKGKQAATVETVERLAIALGVRPCWLAFGEGTERIRRLARPHTEESKFSGAAENGEA